MVNIWKVVLTGAQIVGRAFTKAIQQEINASQQAARARAGASGGGSREDGTRRAASDALSGMSVSEAKQILNVDDLDIEKMKKNYDHLFSINEKAKGGSFYLQSKVYRAHERLEQELSDIEQASIKKQKKDKNSTDS